MGFGDPVINDLKNYMGNWGYILVFDTFLKRKGPDGLVTRKTSGLPSPRFLACQRPTFGHIFAGATCGGDLWCAPQK